MHLMSFWNKFYCNYFDACKVHQFFFFCALNNMDKYFEYCTLPFKWVMILYLSLIMHRSLCSMWWPTVLQACDKAGYINKP